MNANRTPHQERIIKNYYRNRDAIGIQKAQEAITELYLSEGKKRETIWKRLCSHLEKAGLSEKQIQHLREKDDPALVAEAIAKLS
ncbi:hypothetical protein [Roseiconus lacunae]|uniref:Regulatory protein RecX n=1 Tax=Roseiconus lacunae TaxID=2605694 RepID=A0ABT7PCM6_9BACT|nr:hypothetical protein [Roseiconus lacunae]MCD0461659.1 hypothetical protein [Roseiconus lacunae]MDM4014238.1 hypothetical protein [Roseiconus lacunae]WRQ49561.1 hypothetical protein U8335_21705 [Stieleria sp. HD01]